MDVAVDIVLGDGLGDSLGPFDVDILETEVLGGIVAADEVVDDVRVPDTGFDRLGVAQIVFDEDDAAEIAGHLEMALGHLLTEGNDDLTSLACCQRRADQSRAVAGRLNMASSPYLTG